MAVLKTTISDYSVCNKIGHNTAKALLTDLYKSNAKVDDLSFVNAKGYPVTLIKFTFT